MSGFPIQEGKVQRPPLREATLRRDRLLDWLHRKIHSRIVLVTAEAGYGKTTLLADFARHTRLRTLWYRLDEDDRDWATFLYHLVASGRQAEPTFGQATASLLESATPDDRDEIVRTFIAELSELAKGRAALVLDDYHAVEDHHDVRVLVRELLAKSTEELTFVFLSRRRPSLPLARLRALGELAELTASDLRFDLAETERLFRETYGRRLEPDVLADLNRRTEGWVASLHLVQTALRDRSPAETRAFIRNLSGAQIELHDYLAEEVIGDLSLPMQDFLRRTALLQEVVPDLAAIATGQSAAEVEAHRVEAERLGLLSPRATSSEGAQRYHPLVREHLEASVRRDFAASDIRAIHERLGCHLETRNWRLAAHHYAAAGDRTSVARVVQTSTPTIMGTGDYALAQSYIADLADLADHPSTDIVLSRIDLRSERFEEATMRAVAARNRLGNDRNDPLAGLAVANLMAVRFTSGDLVGALPLAEELASSKDQILAAIGRAQRSTILASTVGSIDEQVAYLQDLARIAEERGLTHYHGITALNLAYAARAQGEAPTALSWAEIALDELSRSSQGPEIAAAGSARAWALADLYRLDEAEEELDRATASATGLARVDILIEGADLHTWYGDYSKARSYLSQASDGKLGQYAPMFWLASAQLSAQLGELDLAEGYLNHLQPDTVTTELGFESRRRFVAALIACQRDLKIGIREAHAAAERAGAQGAHFWLWPSRLLASLSDDGHRLAEAIRATTASCPAALGLVSELIVLRLWDLDASGIESVRAEAQRRPGRWRPPIRRALSSHDREGIVAAARLLEEIGERCDIGRLRAVARAYRRSPSSAKLGRRLAIRLANRVYVEDQGRVRLLLGQTIVEGTEIRRKVLALLCLLLTRPDLSATKDLILDALWPELEPDVAVNSLNQTVYFLRRVFEPEYKEDISPGYVHHDSDVLWLNPELVSSRSRQCRDLLRSIGAHPEPEDVARLVETYQGPFALDFAYEEWASAYREWMHSAFLEVVERTVKTETAAGHWESAIVLARQAAAIDPAAEPLEVALLHLYRLTGAHAAAAEQYGHYASTLRNDLGIEPPPLASI